MKKCFVLSAIVLFMQNCSVNHSLFNSDNLKSITILLDSSQSNFRLQPIVIVNHDSLKQIIAKMNDCEREPIKFYPTHTIKLKYNDGHEKQILCSGQSMKYDGLTYRLKENIRNITGS
jgi:hypothetical protein